MGKLTAGFLHSYDAVRRAVGGFSCSFDALRGTSSAWFFAKRCLGTEVEVGDGYFLTRDPPRSPIFNP